MGMTDHRVGRGLRKKMGMADHVKGKGRAYIVLLVLYFFSVGFMTFFFKKKLC